MNGFPLNRRRVLVLLALVVLAGAAGIFLIYPHLARNHAVACRAEGDALKGIKPATGSDPLPDIAFKTADGSEKRLADWRGRGVVLNFWATWCAPCVKEMPELDALKKDLAGDGIDVLAVSEDREGIPVIRRFFDVNKLKNLEPLLDHKGKVARSLGIQGLPTTLFVGPDGVERARTLGAQHYAGDEMKAFIKGCLGGGA